MSATRRAFRDSSVRSIGYPGTGPREPENAPLTAEALQDGAAPAPTLEQALQEPVARYIKFGVPPFKLTTMAECPLPELREIREMFIRSAKGDTPVRRRENLRRAACADLVLAHRQET